MAIKNIMRHPFRYLGIAVFILIPLSLTFVQGQDLKKVIQIVQKMETNLKAQIASEQKAREAEIAELREQILLLQKGTISGNTKKHSKGIQEQAKMPASDPIARLKEGNERYAAGSLSVKEYDKDRAATVSAQHPYAIVLTCADSRVPPELIFDESLGKLFVVRDAGNVVDSVILGSIEYAAEHLHVKLLMILGHEACGAIKATIAGGEVPPNIGSLVWRLKSPVGIIQAKKIKDAELVSACVEENVLYQMKQTIAQSSVLAELVEKGELALIGGVYDLGSGKVKFLSAPVHAPSIEKNEASHGH